MIETYEFKITETEFFWLITSAPHIEIKIEKSGRLWGDIRGMNAHEWGKLSELVIKLIEKKEE